MHAGDEDEGTGERQVGSARFARLPDNVSCEFAVVVADDWQRHGVASELMRRLIAHASTLGLTRMTGSVLSDNVRMLRFSERLGFTVAADANEPGVTAVELALEPPPPEPRRSLVEEAVEETTTRASDLADLASRAVRRARRRRRR